VVGATAASYGYTYDHQTADQEVLDGGIAENHRQLYLLLRN